EIHFELPSRRRSIKPADGIEQYGSMRVSAEQRSLSLELGQQRNRAAVGDCFIRLELCLRECLDLRRAENRALDAPVCRRCEELLPTVLVLWIQARFLNDTSPFSSKLRELILSGRQHGHRHPAAQAALWRFAF